MEEQKYTFAEGSEPIPCEMYITFAVFSAENEFNPSDLTQLLRIEPTATWYKGDMIRENLYRKETSWHLKTPCIEAFEFEEIFKVFINILNDKVEKLRKYTKKNNLSVKIVPVIIVSNNMPSVIITKDIAEFLILLNATMEFDMYFA